MLLSKLFPSSHERVPTEESTPEVDMRDHTGLRGICAVWIMLFHCLLCMKYNEKAIDSGSSLEIHLPIDLQGNTLLPLFYLLSGFGLTAGYLDRMDMHSQDRDSFSTRGVSLTEHHHYTVSGSSTSSGDNSASGKSQRDAWQLTSLGKYFLNRLLRVMPVYYICLIEAIPITLAGFGVVDPKRISNLVISCTLSVIPVSGWIMGFVAIYPLNSPEWTISTLIFFWICFPWLLRYFDKLADEDLLVYITYCFWIQCILIVVLVPVIAAASSQNVLGFWVATSFPLSRLPVFVMGMCGGMLCARHVDGDLPWFKGSGYLIPVDLFSVKPKRSYEVNFVSTAHYQSTAVLSLTMLFIVISVFKGDIGSNWWFQGLNAFALLDLIVALSRSEGRSLVSAVLRSRIVQWLGQLSMSIYLVHWPCIFYLCWILYGNSLTWPGDVDCKSDYSTCSSKEESWNDARQMPPWGLVAVPVISITAAAILYYFVEEPIRKRYKQV